MNRMRISDAKWLLLIAFAWVALMIATKGCSAAAASHPIVLTQSD